MTAPAGNVRKRGMCSLKIYTGSGNSVDAEPWEGDLQISGVVPGFHEQMDLEDRDEFYGTISGKPVYPTMSLTLHHKGRLTDAASKRIWDCLMYTGDFALDSTTDPLGTEPANKIEVVIVAPDGMELYTAPNARVSVDYSTGEKNTFAISWTCRPATKGGLPLTIS